MAVRPRKRAKKFNSHINAYADVADLRLLDILGFKAGMAQASFVETRDVPAKGSEVTKAVTLIEFPATVCFGVRYFKADQVLADIYTEDKPVLEKIGIKNPEKTEEPKEFDDLRLLVYSTPSATGIGQKKPIKYEIGIGGDNGKKQEVAKKFLGKPIRASDVFRKGEYVDVVGVTKGKGWQGSVKRFGIALQRRKATGKRRHLGTMGPWTPSYVMYTVPMAGQTGFHNRTELNKRILDITSEQNMITKITEFHKYGFIRNDFIVVEGSVMGPPKRMLKLKLSMRKKSTAEPAELLMKSYLKGEQ